jgi:methionine synthase I (cobalamin-dependent)
VGVLRPLSHFLLRISGGARHIVFEPRIETGQIKLAVDQVIHRVFESAGQKLPLQINSEKSRTGIYVFVTRHLRLQNIVPHFDIDIKFGSRQDAV